MRASQHGFVLFVTICSLVYLAPLRLTNGEERTVSLSLVVSDTELLVCDSLPYKLVVWNRTNSSVQLRNVKSQPKTQVIQYLECRYRDKDWDVIREVSADKAGKFMGDLVVEGNSRFAFYGQFFLKDNRDCVFSEPREYELRIRLSCLLGEFATEPRRINVKKRPVSEVASLTNSRKLLELILSPMSQSSLLEETKSIQKTLHSGAARKTMDLRVMTQHFKETGKILEKDLGILAAYTVAADGLDEVRRDVATSDFIWIAHQRKEWADLAKLLDNLKEDSNVRRTFAGELENAVQLGLYRPEKP